MLVVGGMGSVSGSVIGATVMLGLGEALRRFEDPTQLYGIGGIIIASVLIAVLIFRPAGIMGQREISLDRLFAPLRRDRDAGRATMSRPDGPGPGNRRPAPWVERGSSLFARMGSSTSPDG